MRNRSIPTSTREGIRGTPKSSKERTRAHRERVYTNAAEHKRKRERDNVRKYTKRVAEKSHRKTNTIARILYNESEAIRKRAYRKRKREADAAANQENELPVEKTEVRNQVKNAMRRVRRSKDRIITQLMVRVEGLLPNTDNNNNDDSDNSSDSNDISNCDNSASNNDPDSDVSKLLWNHMSPRTKTGVKLKLKDASLTRGQNSAVRRSLNVNLSNPIAEHVPTTSELAKDVETFFSRDDVSRLCPDKRRTVRDPESGEKKQVRWRLGYLNQLYEKFVAECHRDCHLTTFQRYVPIYVLKPKASDWGTCLCQPCLNPELKVEKAVRLGLLTNANLEKMMGEDGGAENLLKEIEKITYDKDVSFHEWKMVPKETATTSKRTSSKSKVSRKVNIVMSVAQFKQKLKQEILLLKDHLVRVRTQYRAFKQAREEATENEGVATTQIDWSENSRIRQAFEEKSAYYYEDQVSIHAGYLWFGETKQSFAAISEETNHKAPAVFASISPILNSLVEKGAKKINVVSDSPTSQYRNKNIFFYMKNFSETSQVSVKWVYLESGHGKGIPDGIGATVKRAIADIVPFNPNLSVYSCEDLVNLGLQKMLPSIDISLYTQEDIKRYSDILPNLRPVHGTMKSHEVSSTVNNNNISLSMKELSSSNAKVFSLQEKREKICATRKKNLKKKRLFTKLVKADDESEEENEKEEDRSGDEEVKDDVSSSEEEVDDDVEDTDEEVNVEKEAAADHMKENEEEDALVHFNNHSDQKNVPATFVPVPKVHKLVRFEDLKIDDWVLAKYEGTYFPGVVLKLFHSTKLAQIKCLMHPHGVNMPQLFESTVNHVVYKNSDIYEITVKPKLCQVGRSYKYMYDDGQ